MGFFNRIQSWLATRSIRRQYRYPALAAANRVLFLLESQITDFSQISAAMEAYKKAQDIKEPERDSAYIPIYFDLEQFIASHQPPVVKAAFTVPQVREMVRQNVDIKQLNEDFRLVFLNDSAQADHLLKIGARELLRFLLKSLGQAQLGNIVKEAMGQTPLGLIAVNDDGISFEVAHRSLSELPKSQVVALYGRLYQALYGQIKDLFGEPAAQELVTSAHQKIAALYPAGFVSLFLNALPAEARP